MPKSYGSNRYVSPYYASLNKFQSNRVVRWVIEAKSPIELLDIDVVEQAFTYANHPEVGAIYFCLCNAHEFQVYQTSSGAHSPPILKVAYADLQNSLSTLENLVGPLAIRRDWKDQSIDCGKPIGPGLRSIVQITGGFIEYHGSNQPDARLSGITVSITDGAIERDEKGHLIGFFRMRSPFAQVQRTVEKLGLNGFEAICTDSTLSTDRDTPSKFYSVQTLRFPKGENLYDFTSGKEVSLPMEIAVKAETFAVGHLEGEKFSGIFKAKLNLGAIAPPMITEGKFQVFLA